MKGFISFLLLFCFILPASAYGENAPNLVPSVSAPSAILMEKLTGQVIYEKNSRERLHPASVTTASSRTVIAMRFMPVSPPVLFPTNAARTPQNPRNPADSRHP